MSSHKILLILLMGALGAAGCARTQVKPADPPPEEVLVSMPVVDDVTDYEEFIGHTEAVFSVDVRARVNGYLKEVNFKDGDEVEKGAVLFEIDPRPYEATYKNQAAIVEQGKARLTRTSADHRRADALLQRNAIGREEYDRIQGDYAESRATIGAAEAMLDTAQLNLDWTKVTSPISGRLSRRLVDPGNLVKADETLLTNVVSLDPLYVYFDIDERTLLKIRRLIADGRVQSRTDTALPVLIGLADEFNFPHTGVIDFSDNKVDAATGTLRIRGSLPNPGPRRLFSPGLFVRIRLPIGKSHKSILITEQAVGTDQGRKYVYIIKNSKIKDKKTNQERDAEIVVSQPVKVGTMINGMRVIDEGLALGDRIVVSGLQRVRPGKEVAPRMLADNDKNKLTSSPKVTSPGDVTAAAPPAVPAPATPKVTPTAAATPPTATH